MNRFYLCEVAEVFLPWFGAARTNDSEWST